MVRKITPEFYTCLTKLGLVLSPRDLLESLTINFEILKVIPNQWHL